MTEKRFAFVIDNGEDTFYDLSKNGEIMNMIDTEDMLNELNDEIEMLKSKLEDCEFAHRTEMAHHRVIEKDLKKENEQLKQALKNSYINEICENCKYGNYFLSDNYDGGFEGDFECLKKHFGNEHWKCDGLTECDEFELEIKGDVECY